MGSGSLLGALPWAVQPILGVGAVRGQREPPGQAEVPGVRCEVCAPGSIEGPGRSRPCLGQVPSPLEVRDLLVVTELRHSPQIQCCHILTPNKTQIDELIHSLIQTMIWVSHMTHPVSGVGFPVTKRRKQPVSCGKWR